MQHDGAGGVLLQLGTRETVTGDLEEHQLVNVVNEMAIAAGLPAPQVLLITGGRDKGQSPAVIAASLLAESMADRRMNEINVILDAPEAHSLNPVMKVLLNARRIVLIPWLLLSLFGKMVLTVVGSVLMGQSIAWAWRTRRFLADATAVQLTRNPDGLGRALEALAARGGLIPGGEWASHLFIVGGGAASEGATADRMRRMAELREQVSDKLMAERIRRSMEAARSAPAEAVAAQAGRRTEPLAEKRCHLVTCIHRSQSD